MGNDVIKIGNCSGYYGDKLSAAKDMVEGGPIDVLTGDYLAELTMTILFNQKLQRGQWKLAVLEVSSFFEAWVNHFIRKKLTSNGKDKFSFTVM